MPKGTLHARDVDGDALMLSVSTLPTWLVFIAVDSTITLQGTPAFGDVGAHPVVVQVRDGTDVAEAAVFITVVDGVPAAPGRVSFLRRFTSPRR